jgi:hypothetical protein
MAYDKDILDNQATHSLAADANDESLLPAHKKTDGDNPAHADNIKTRRNFLKLSGAVGAVALGGTASSVMAFNPAAPAAAAVQSAVIELGSGDIGVLNYAYLLEQLEAAFYTEVVSAPYQGITAEERQVLIDLRDHEIIHREFFRAVLGANAIPNASFNFSKVDFTSRDSVLAVSQVFEDTGVAAYNGAGQLLESTEYLVLAGKIVSVEARHAATIRSLRFPRIGYFAPDADDPALDPLVVLTTASPFIEATVSARNLPRITAV